MFAGKAIDLEKVFKFRNTIFNGRINCLKGHVLFSDDFAVFCKLKRMGKTEGRIGRCPDSRSISIAFR